MANETTNGGAHWSAQLAQLYEHRGTVEKLLRAARREERERVFSLLLDIAREDDRRVVSKLLLEEIQRSFPDADSVWPRLKP